MKRKSILFVDFPAIVNGAKRLDLYELFRKFGVLCKLTAVKLPRRILDYFKEPDEEIVEKILKERFGIKESDESYALLKTRLTKLIGKRARQQDFSDFLNEFCLQLHKKKSKWESELKDRVRSETYQELKEQITRSRQQIISEATMETFSPPIWTLTDRPIFELLKLLSESDEDLESLKRHLNLTNEQLLRRLFYLKDLGFIETRYSHKDESYSLSEVGKAIFEKRGIEFEGLIDLLGDKVHQLALKAVGGDKIIAETLMNWLKSSSGRGHMGIVEKLGKKHEGDPKKVSQAFFDIREMGANHEKHIRVKIVDHQSSGELLLLELEKLHSYNQKVTNSHPTAHMLLTHQSSEMKLTKTERGKNGFTVRTHQLLGDV